MSGVFFGVASLLCMVVAYWFDSRGAFVHVDAIFNADAPWYIRGFVDGRGTGTSWGPRSLVHPNLAHMVYPVVQGLSRMAAWLTADERAAEIRRAVALAACPVAAGIETAIIYSVLRPLVANAGLLALIHMVGFSTLLYGAMPESFAFTGLGMALLFWILEVEYRTGKRRPYELAAIGTFLVSVTSTNVILLTLAVIAHRWARPQGRPAVAEAVFTAACSVIVTATLALIGIAWLGGASDYAPKIAQIHDAPLLRMLRTREPTSTDETQMAVYRYARRAGLDLPLAFAASYIARVPTIVVARDSKPPVALSYERTGASWWRLAAAVIALGAAFFIIMRPRTRREPLFVAAAAIVVFNWCFHTFFGEELILYSKHWVVAATLLFGALVPRRSDVSSARTIARPVLWVILVLVSSYSAKVTWTIGHAFP